MPYWLSWLLAPELGSDKLTLLLLCLPTIHVLSTNLGYRLGRRHLYQPLQWMANSWLGRWLAQGQRAIYYLGPPLTVLWRSPPVLQMDLLPTRTDAPLPFGIADLISSLSLGGGALVLSVAIWVWYINTVHHVEETENTLWWKALREATFAQSLWALYRSVLRALPMDAIYASAFALAIITATWLLDPRRREELFTPRGHLVVQEWMWAFFTTCLAPTVHFWPLLIPLHALWLWASSRVRLHLLADVLTRQAVLPSPPAEAPLLPSDRKK